MQIAFLSVAAFGGAYFLIWKRSFDYFTLAFFSAIIYFLPGFFGIRRTMLTAYGDIVILLWKHT